MPTTPQYRRKLIEVALPLEAINKESAREKSIRHGHPSTLHLWWARRPLAACRAVLFASIVDDPSAWPELFPTEEKQKEERQRLFKIIEELVKWDHSNNRDTLFKAHTEIARSISRSMGQKMPLGADAIRKYIIEHAPPVLDPFCGGGSIPLEAQRLGLEAHGSDLNPVAVLITKSLIEIPPKYSGKPAVNPEAQAQKTIVRKWEGAKGLAEDIRYYGKWMRDEAEKRIGHLYPKITITPEMTIERPDIKKYIGNELPVVAWLWARTVTSPNPAVNGAQVPLIKTFWLSTNKGKEAWIEPIIDRTHNSYNFVVRVGHPPADCDPKNGTVIKKSSGTLPKGARCLISNEKIDFEYIRREGKQGRLHSRLIAIVAKGNSELIYLSPQKEHEIFAESAHPTNYPETDLPIQALSFRTQLYGMDKHFKLFTPRQLVALTTFSDMINDVKQRIQQDAINSHLNTCNTNDYSNAVATYLAFSIDKAADYWSTIATWMPRGTVGHAFSKHALPMTWDFPEANPFADFHCAWSETYEWVSKVIEELPILAIPGYCKQLDAVASMDQISALVSTDPPYYDNIGYSDLSDFFYVWLRRSLNNIYPSLFATMLTPKKQELIASPYRHDGDRAKSMAFFEDGLKNAFSNIQSSQNKQFPMTVFYAFKQAENDDDNREQDLQIVSTGWESMLSGLIRSGFIIQGTWPMRTERSARSIGIGTNALASSIVLVCRPRPVDAPLATRREFITAMKQELPSALKTLQQSSIAPVDLAQAAIGPGMAVFTRYMKVMESDGSPMTVRTALALINQTLDEVLAEQEGEFDSDTRWAIAWFEQFGMNDGAYGTAETLSKAKNTAINALVEDGLIIAKAGKVKLVARNELPEDWDPAKDKRLTAWESTQHLIRALDQKGENGAAELLKKLGSGMGETARDLAYRLYVICDRKKWTTEALSYNSLVTSWSEIQNLVHAAERTKQGQQTFTGENE